MVLSHTVNLNQYKIKWHKIRDFWMTIHSIRKLLQGQYPDLRNCAKWLWADGGSTEVQHYESRFLFCQQPPQVPQWQQSWRILNCSHRTPSIWIKFESDVATSQREAAELRGTASEPTECEVREVAQIRQIQLLQTRQSWPDLQI